jgi:subtilisin family serine protease
MVPGASAPAAIKAVDGSIGRRLSGDHGQVAVVADSELASLAGRADVLSIALDRRVQGTLERTSATVGAAFVREETGVDGSGVGVAIIDSGVANWHDDLGNERVVHFADFVTHLPQPNDDYGHGTHVAGIIAGSGYDSAGARRGIAPGASLVVLKVLDGAGDGYISNVIAAIDYAVEQRDRFNIRVLNLSVAAGVYESYTSDPFTLAARRAVDAGIVVVTAAGNLGRSESGQTQRGGITAPGNAPWVLTVGASNHQRTTTRSDDTLAQFSSRGPTNIDRAMKPDIAAPGVGIESLASVGSTIYTMNPSARLAGTVDTAAPPYLSMTGTSMAAPVVAGTVALMYQINPNLTPNLAKAIVQFTAERRARLELTAQGAGFLNTSGAVRLAAALARDEHSQRDIDAFAQWSRHVIWGNKRVRGAALSATANSWRTDVVWGASTTDDGEPVVLGIRNGTGAGSGVEAFDAMDADSLDVAFDAASERPGTSYFKGFARPARSVFLAVPLDERRRPRKDGDGEGTVDA